jgi:hypothetical protein
MPAFCSLCAADDHTSEGVTEDGTKFAVCLDPSHGEGGYTWEPRQPGGGGSRQGGGLGAELGIWEKLLDSVPLGDDFLSYGVVEDAFLEHHPIEGRVLGERYGHRWRPDMPRTTSSYSMSVYLSTRLRELSREGLLDVRWGPAEGPWSYNGIISYWRHHTETDGEMLGAAEEPALPAPTAPSALSADADQVARIAVAAADLPPAEQDYTQDDFITGLMETVLDYQMQAKAVGNALQFYRANRWDEVRTMDDLEGVLARFPDDQEGNTALAGHLWGNRHWTRAHQLRDLTAFFRSIDVADRPALKAWAEQAEFKRDFAGRVKGLGTAVFQWLVMRQGIDTVKPDVHVRRFAEAAVGRNLSDAEVVDLVTRAATELNIPARELDWRIWEAARRG